jgi:two-component system nitrogen regulation response regulator GlnG
LPTLLIVDDEPSILRAFRRAFGDAELSVLTAATASEGLQRAAAERPDVILLDILLPDGDGLDTLRRLREQDARRPVILITGRSTADTAIEAMKRGAFEYLLKPPELAHVRQVVERALAVSRLARIPAVFAADADPAHDGADAIVGRSPAMQEVYKAIGRVAPQDGAVLISGETGTGKELVARAVYGHSRRASGPFLAVNGAAIPEGLLESELFGHEKGAFTGAERRRIGLVEQCAGGTLFLDEVGDLTPLTQSKLLRFLQDGTFQRLGGDETLQADVRVLAATNHDLAADVSAGRFRKDLYYRLGVFPIHLPPLRERGADLGLLIGHYLRRYNRELGRQVEKIDRGAEALLRRHRWPGNVRELQSVLKQALVRAAGSVLLAEFLPDSLHEPARGAADPAVEGAALESFIDAQLLSGTSDLYPACLRRMERTLLTRVLRHTGGNQARAAKLLGITRGSLRTKMRDLGLRVDRAVHDGEEI